MVRPSLPIEVAYQVFKRMEMRQIIIVDEEHHPQAVLTRKSLLPWVVEERLDEEGRFVGKSALDIVRPSSFFTSAVLGRGRSETTTSTSIAEAPRSASIIETPSGS